jgi:hypothetical protein
MYPRDMVIFQGAALSGAVELEKRSPSSQGSKRWISWDVLSIYRSCQSRVVLRQFSRAKAA